MNSKSKPPVVLCISPAAIDGYPPTQYQAVLLADAGFRVVVLTSYLTSSKSADFKYPRVNCIRFPLSSGCFVRRQFANLCFLLCLVCYRFYFGAEIKAEIAYDPKGVFLANLLPLRARKFVAHLHEALTSNSKLDFYDRFLLRNGQKFPLVVVADEQRGILLQQQARCQLHLAVVRNVPLLQSLTAGIGKGASEFERPFSVVYHGSLGPAQAIDTIVESIAFWPIGVNFHIYGNADPARRKELEALARQHGVSNRMQFEGWVPTSALIEKLRNHSVGLSMLRPITDNWRYSAGASNKRYQYMQAGLPQISDDSPDVIALVEGNGVGFCVSPDDSGAIAAKVRFLYENNILRKEMGQRGRRLHETKFNYQQEFSTVVEFLLTDSK